MLDLFRATRDNWGLIYAIRTGSAEYSHQVLATGWKKKGYESREGILWKENKPTYIREEEEIFKLIGMQLVPPEERSL
jgi:DNA polymerase/3'-5' exonuclease PolX